jgi:glycosyltransferase involved in cell wall biosynthesis
MKINCIIGPFYPVPPALGSSIEKIFLALCEEFAARGHEVTIISREFRDFALDETVNGVRHLRVKSFDRPGNVLLYRLMDVVYGLRVRRMLPKADVTIVNSVAIPLLIPHGRAGKIYVDVARYPKGQMAIYRRVDRLQACSTHIARAICEQSPSVAHLVKAIPNAVTSIFASLTEQPLGTERAKEIVYVGRLAREKGVHLLIRAFAQIGARHPDWKVVVVGPHREQAGGDGEAFLQELKELAESSGANIAFAGPIFDETKLAEQLLRSAIFVYPSIAERGEAFPVAPLEAMACGCAPVVSDLRCFDDAVERDVNGLVFDHLDESGTPLAQVLERLINDETLRQEIAEGAKRTSRRYVPSVVADQFLDDFAQLTGLPANPPQAAIPAPPELTPS